ncbi:MAG: hypothetical protein ACRDQZ_11790 [Mycobacteriales bacterium]
MRHGRAVMPWGKYKGVKIRLLPDDYLSFLTGLNLMKDANWRWLLDSLIAELKFRGLRYDLAGTAEPCGCSCSLCLNGLHDAHCDPEPVVEQSSRLSVAKRKFRK